MIIVAGGIIAATLGGLIIGTTLLARRFTRQRGKIQAIGIISYLTLILLLLTTFFSIKNLSVSDNFTYCTATDGYIIGFPYLMAWVDVANGSGLKCAGPNFVRYDFQWNLGGLLSDLSICLILASLIYTVILGLTRIRPMSPTPTAPGDS